MVDVTYGSPVISGQITVGGTKRTVQSVSGQNDGTSTATLGTVGASKVWRVIGMSLNDSVNTTTHGNAKILLNDVEVLRCGTVGLASVVGSNSASWTGSYESAFVLAAGETVKLTGEGAGQRGYASVFYIEEDA